MLDQGPAVVVEDEEDAEPEVRARMLINLKTRLETRVGPKVGPRARLRVRFRAQARARAGAVTYKGMGWRGVGFWTGNKDIITFRFAVTT